MIWLAWLSLAGLFALLSEGGPRRALLAICVGLVSVWLAKLALHESPFWVFSALIWVLIGGYIATLGSSLFTWGGLLLILAGVAVAPGRFSGGAYAFGNPWLAISDILGVAAIIVLAWPAVSDLAHRVGSVVGGDRGSDYTDRPAHSARKTQE